MPPAFTRPRWEWLILAAWLLAVLGSCTTEPSEARKVAKDLYLRPLNQAVGTSAGQLQLQVLICQGTIGQSTRAVLARPVPGEPAGLEVFAATPEFHRHTWHADCAAGSCTVHALGASAHPDASYRPPVLTADARRARSSGWRVCTRDALNGVAAFEPAPRPLLLPAALVHRNVINSTAAVLWPVWVTGALLMMVWRLEDVPPTARTLFMLGVLGAGGFIGFFTAMVAILAGLIVRWEIAAVLTLVLWGAVWRLAGPRRKPAPA